jgi:hypothetical protein
VDLRKERLRTLIEVRIRKEKTVLVDLSPAAYLALCALVREALEHESDASPLLNRVAAELARAIANDEVPAEFANQPERLEALRRAVGGQA